MATRTQRKPKVETDAHGREIVPVQMQGTAPALASDGKREWTAAERRALVERAERGDRAALPELRQMFAAHPDAAARLFDPARTLTYDLARQVGDAGDVLFPELVMARADAVRRDLEGDNPTGLERLLCERVATCWLALHFLDIRTPTDTASLTLAKVRRLLRPEVQQVNIAAPGSQQLNVGQFDAPAPRKPAALT